MAKAADNNDPAKMYSADVVAAVLTASGTTSLSMKQYELMSAMDGTRTASSFQHAFRAVLAKAKDLKTRVDNGEVFEPVQPTMKRGM
jgi:tryptophanase